jgi:hypothetical protein
MFDNFKTVFTIKEAIIYSIENTIVWYEKNNVRILFIDGNPVLRIKE